MATLTVNARVDGTDYVVGSGSTGTQDHIREVWFGPFAGGSGPNHFDLRNITVGTTSYGSSDLFAPALTGLGNFDGFAGAGANPTFSGGIMSFNNTNDRYGYHDLGVPYYDIYVQFDIRVYADDNDPDYHDIADEFGAQIDGIFNGGGSWSMDGVGSNFGTGPVQDGTTWQTVGLHWHYPTPTPTPVDDAYSCAGGHSLTIAAPGVMANDILPTTVSLNTGPSHGSLILNADGSFFYDPVSTYSGTDTFVYNGNGGTATVTITIVFATATAIFDASPILKGYQ